MAHYKEQTDHVVEVVGRVGQVIYYVIISGLHITALTQETVRRAFLLTSALHNTFQT